MLLVKWAKLSLNLPLPMVSMLANSITIKKKTIVGLDLGIGWIRLECRHWQDASSTILFFIAVIISALVLYY